MSAKSESQDDLTTASCSNEVINMDDTKINERTKKKQQTGKPVSFLQMYKYATRMDKIMLIVGLICMIIAGCLQSLLSLFLGMFIQSVIDFHTDRSSSTISDKQKQRATEVFTNEITNYGIYGSLISLLILLLVATSSALFDYSTLKQILKIRLLYLKSVLNQDISWYDIHNTGGFASRMSEDINRLREGMGEKVSSFLYIMSFQISTAIMAILTGWKLSLICFIPLVFTIILMRILMMFTSKLIKKEIDTYAAAGAIAQEVLSSIKTVVAFGGQQKETTRYSEKLMMAKKHSIRRSLLMGVSNAVLWLCIYSSYTVGVWYAANLLYEERNLPIGERVYDVGNIITVFIYAQQVMISFNVASPFIEVFAAAKASAAKIFSLIESAPTINQSKGKGDRPKYIRGKIVFKNVHFSYPSRPNVAVLQGLNLHIKPYEKVALVGSSGCGKSTCIQLIQRFYDPSCGQIYLDGNEIDELDLTWLRSKIGVVGQEPILFNTTIAENIKYGNISATQEDIQRAAKIANAHKFIKSLPQGYDTLVGERGLHLSGGQKQRIAIARAVVRRPSILLLDEATSALDTKSQAQVQTALDQASKNCTTIIIAHRLSTIRTADRVLVLSEGKIVEEGTHESLMKQKGSYYNLVTAQISQNISLESEEHNGNAVEVYDNKISGDAQDDVDKGSDMEADKSKKMRFWTIVKNNRPKWWIILTVCLSALVIGANGPIFVVIQGDIIGVLSLENHNKMFAEIRRYIILLALLGISISCFMFIQTYMFCFIGIKFTLRLRSQMFPAMLRQEIGWFDRKENGIGALCARLSGEPAKVQGATGQTLEILIRSVTIIILSVSLSMYYSWKLTLVALVFMPILFVTAFFQKRFLGQQNAGEQASLEDSIRVFVEAVSNIRTVASLGCENTFYELYKSALLRHGKNIRRNIYISAFVFGIARCFMFVTFSVCIYYGGILVRDENLAVENVFKVIVSITRSTLNLANGISFMTNLQKGFTAAGNIFQLLNRTPQITNPQHPKSFEWKNGHIKYSNVRFSYPTRPNSNVLKNLDLSLLQGKTVALVGPSGCGKSTVLQLLERYYDPTDGKISVDGENIKDLNLDTFRAGLGIVSQEPNLFDKTIAENIAYGDNNRAVELDEVIEAAKNANIHDFVASLPLGYDTKLGEHGAQLSGGQKQRIAIARALVKNPRVLLLDEATSALDSEGEKVVQEALTTAQKGRTCIIIAHRLATIQDADVICVLNNGRVAEMGKHLQLLRRKGLYYRLYYMPGCTRN